MIYDMIRYDKYDTIRYDMIYDMIWYDMMLWVGINKYGPVGVASYFIFE